jgi:hypothetical protein
MASPHSRLKRLLHRVDAGRVGIWLLLAWFAVLSTGFSLPLSRRRSDSSERFPCENCGCGWRMGNLWNGSLPVLPKFGDLHVFCPMKSSGNRGSPHLPNRGGLLTEHAAWAYADAPPQRGIGNAVGWQCRTDSRASPCLRHSVRAPLGSNAWFILASLRHGDTEGQRFRHPQPSAQCGLHTCRCQPLPHRPCEAFCTRFTEPAHNRSLSHANRPSTSVCPCGVCISPCQAYNTRPPRPSPAPRRM